MAPSLAIGPVYGVFLTQLGTPVTVLTNIFYFTYLLHQLEPELHGKKADLSSS